MILGTAGHIDHGKTTLVKALTGVDTDRLPEEKRRGITIELGFAPLDLAGVGTLGVVDVPGHEAFVRTMLAGATGVDLALLVVAADEGVMPQTREHLAILSLLGVRGGVVALTKSDLVEGEWLRLVEDDVRAVLRGSPLERAAIVPCSATTRAGLDALCAALGDAARAVPARDPDDLPRLPIDRVFSVRGTGTVVTGTLWSGSLAREATVRLFPPGRTARVRALESHGRAVDRAGPGSRVAVALAGLDKGDVARGTVLVGADDPWKPSTVLRADVALLDEAKPVGVRTRVRFHLGTADVGARVVAAGGRVTPGAVVPVRVTLDEPVVARATDRFVLRAATPVVTIGGGVVTDPHPHARRARPWPSSGASPAQRLGWIVAESAGEGFALGEAPVRLGATRSDVARIAAQLAGTTRVGDRLYSTALADATRARLTSLVERSHTEHPLEPGLSLQHARTSLKVSSPLFDAVLSALAAESRLTVHGGVVARTGWKPASRGADAQRLDLLSAVLEAAGPQPPSVRELTDRLGASTPALLRALEREGRAVAVASDRYYARPAVDALVARLRAGAADGRPRTASQLREILGLTRKYLIPFLEFCDQSGVTARSGDTRTLRAAG
ncbi:MAG TPA: selenocysteine-specific translation elongation factor [Gemmatimonadaceae bacterium]|nr:selenocysteine-specific translation elongation factor [Gemmatimonadaceae bacterium]